MPMPCDECHDFAICLSEIIKIIEIEGEGLSPTDPRTVSPYAACMTPPLPSSYKHPLTATTPLILLFG